MPHERHHLNEAQATSLRTTLLRLNRTIHRLKEYTNYG